LKNAFVILALVLVPFTVMAQENWVVTDNCFLVYKDLNTFSRAKQLATQATTPQGKVDLNSPAGQRFLDFLKEIALNGKGAIFPKGAQLEVLKQFEHKVKLPKGMWTYPMMEIVSEDSKTHYYWDVPKGKLDDSMVRKPRKAPFAPVTYKVVKENAHGYTFMMAYLLSAYSREEGGKKTSPLFEAGVNSGTVKRMPIGTEVVIKRASVRGPGLILGMAEIEGNQYWIPMEYLEKK
jgi:hypothetical protein